MQKEGKHLVDEWSFMSYNLVTNIYASRLYQAGTLAQEEE
jgi:hypothetical protein